MKILEDGQGLIILMAVLNLAIVLARTAECDV